MKKLPYLFLSLLLADFIFAQPVSFSGITSVFATYVHENDSSSSSQNTESTNMLGLQDISLRFLPDDNISAWLDASFNGSLMQYKDNDIPVSNPFTLDINQIYIVYNTDSDQLFAGKKVFNYGYSTHFPLVNLVNPRRDDKVRLVSEGTGALGLVTSPVDWTTLSGITYFNSTDRVGSLDDISTVLISDFFYKNYSLSVYSYFLKTIDSVMIEHFFSDFDAFKDALKNGETKTEFPFACSGSAQFGLFTLYSEILYLPSPMKFSIVKAEDDTPAMERVAAGNYWDAMAGCRFISSKFSFELEYCRAKSAYNVEEADEIYDYLRTAPNEISRAYNSSRMFFRHNAVATVSYMPVPELALSLTDKITFPEFGCDSAYIGNQTSFGINYNIKQVLDIICSFSYGFGGDKSEFAFYNQHDLSISLGGKLYF